jgi:hypothetical protein
MFELGFPVAVRHFQTRMIEMVLGIMARIGMA